MSLMRLLD